MGMCGHDRDEAMAHLAELERLTCTTGSEA
jgi:hypothetical protein